jgi:hypothetical protein
MVMKKARYFVHFKGGLYKLIGFAHHSETFEDLVVYQALYGTHEIWVRPMSLFFSKVIFQGIEMDRFKEITKEEMLCLLQKQKESI